MRISIFFSRTLCWIGLASLVSCAPTGNPYLVTLNNLSQPAFDFSRALYNAAIAGSDLSPLPSSEARTGRGFSFEIPNPSWSYLLSSEKRSASFTVLDSLYYEVKFGDRESGGAYFLDQAFEGERVTLIVSLLDSGHGKDLRNPYLLSSAVFAHAGRSYSLLGIIEDSDILKNRVIPSSFQVPHLYSGGYADFYGVRVAEAVSATLSYPEFPNGSGLFLWNLVGIKNDPVTMEGKQFTIPCIPDPSSYRHLGPGGSWVCDAIQNHLTLYQGVVEALEEQKMGDSSVSFAKVKTSDGIVYLHEEHPQFANPETTAIEKGQQVKFYAAPTTEDKKPDHFYCEAGLSVFSD